jgi:hypothetical protein
MTLLVSDETDLVELNLEYHLARGVDFVIVTANRPADGIVETVERYVREGVARLIHEPAQIYAQSEWVTRMARLAAAEHMADWVINCDPDEFYWPEGGNLKEVLSAIPAQYGVLPMPVCNFVPRPSEDGFFADRMTVREVCSVKTPLRLAAAPMLDPFQKVAHRAIPDVIVRRGNHEAYGAGLDHVPGWRPIVGFHFPLRSYAQYEAKTIKDGQAAANNPDRKVSQAVWRDRYEIYLAGGLPQDYAARVVDDEQVAIGVREGRLVIDERLKRFLGTSAELSPADLAQPPDPERVAQLQVEMRRAIRAFERNPVVLERDRLKEALETADSRICKLEGELKRSQRARRKLGERLEKTTRRLEKANVRRAELTAALPHTASRQPAVARCPPITFRMKQRLAALWRGKEFGGEASTRRFDPVAPTSRSEAPAEIGAGNGSRGPR